MSNEKVKNNSNNSAKNTDQMPIHCQCKSHESEWQRWFCSWKIETSSDFELSSMFCLSKDEISSKNAVTFNRVGLSTIQLTHVILQWTFLFIHLFINFTAYIKFWFSSNHRHFCAWAGHCEQDFVLNSMLTFNAKF